MPLTFIDIEQRKNWRIGVFFLFLLLLYCAVGAAFAATFLSIPVFASLRHWIYFGVLALLVTGIHFWFSASDAVASVIRGLNGQTPDPQDDLHRMFDNIVQEIQVVTGGKRRIRSIVIPSLSLNALAVADLKGEAAIGITEGLLSRLTRSQLEAVVAHEAHHILSGDCLETTVASSLFGAYASAIEQLRGVSRGRSFLSPALLLAWLLLKLGYLLNMLISREREYRADAAAVRMTRNPLALAETLHLLSRSWRGAGFIGSGYEMLCIVNPQATTLDETEGFWADLISTHPPILSRMNILLKMARVSIGELDSRSAEKNGAAASPETPTYFAMSPRQEWQGPFALAELALLPWLSPLTWITSGDTQAAARAWHEPLLNTVFTDRLKQQEHPVSSSFACPVCMQPLVVASYEGTKIHQCHFCAGTLVKNSRIPRILARTGRERPCSGRVNALARAVSSENRRMHAARRLSGTIKNTTPVSSCPSCHNSMYRGFYSSAHLIEIDRCTYCELTWFDQDELAMLQCLIENRIMPDSDQPAS